MTPLRIIDERSTEAFLAEYLLRPITATEGGVWVPVPEIDPDDLVPRCVNWREITYADFRNEVLEPVSRAAFWQAISIDTYGEIRRQKQRGRIICERCCAMLATYADACAAKIGDRCPGLLAVERAEFGN